jgi:hypothetical protein
MELVPTIIDQLVSLGNYGGFFPIELSLFAYDESTAQDYYPLTKEQIESRGWLWKEIEETMSGVTKTIPASNLPQSINEVPDEILQWAIECSVSKRQFRIVKPELEFYRSMQLPIPHLHPMERHKKRMRLQSSRKLWKRKCSKCSKEIETIYAPERPETVYCESCYLEEVY